MTQVTVAEAQQRLSELLAAVETGETVSIRGDNGRTFQLTAQTPARIVNPAWPGYPHAGSCKDLFVVPKDFKEPLEELHEYLE